LTKAAVLVKLVYSSRPAGQFEEDRRQKAEGRRQKTEGRGQKTEGRGQKTGVRIRNLQGTKDS